MLLSDARLRVYIYAETIIADGVRYSFDQFITKIESCPNEEIKFIVLLDDAGIISIWSCSDWVIIDWNVDGTIYYEDCRDALLKVLIKSSIADVEEGLLSGDRATIAKVEHVIDVFYHHLDIIREESKRVGCKSANTRQ